MQNLHEEPEKVYTLNTNEYQIKVRLIHCPTCKYYVKSSVVGAICNECNSKMITVINPDELAKQSS